MTNDIKIRNPSDIHVLFKSIRDKSDFFSFPRFEAFLHSFRILEGIHNNHYFGLKGIDDALQSSKSFQDTMKYLIYWIYTECPEGGRFIFTDDSHIEKTIPIIELAHNYSMIHDFVVAAQKNWVLLETDEKQKLISFKYSDLTKGVLFFGKFVDRLLWEAKNIMELKENKKNEEVMKKAINQLAESVYVTKDNELKYTTNKFILDALEKSLTTSLEKGFILPESWSIGPYSVKEFRLIWKQLCKLSVIYIFVFNICLEKYNKNKDILNNSIFRINKGILINYIKKYTDLNEDIITEVIKDLTYDYKIPFMDIIYQPLIEMNRNEIFYSPNLILGSNIDRNLQVLLTKLPYRQKEYDRLKNLKEDKMIQDIAFRLNANGFKLRPKTILRESNRIITDIDLLIWDNTYKNFLIAELKWFYGADSTQEVFNQDEQFKEGINNTKSSIEFLINNFEKISSLIEIPESKSKKNFFGVIISKSGTPSPFIEDQDFPVLDEEDFYELINLSDGNVKKLYGHITSLFESKKKIPNIKESFYKLNVGEFKFVLPAFEY